MLLPTGAGKSLVYQMAGLCLPGRTLVVDPLVALIEDQQDGDASMTVFFSGCPGADVTVERVVQLTSNRLLWVQVRSDDRATANQVLESVTTYGI